MNELKKTLALGSIVCLNLAAASLGHAADISWSRAADITSDTDVITTGTLIQATSLGDNTDAGTTVNGVYFNGWDLNHFNSDGVFAFNNSQVSPGNATESVSGFAGYGTDTGGGTDPIDGLSPNYASLLNFGDFGDGNSLMTLTISGLTLGQTYQFEWWANDSRGFLTQDITASAGNDVTLHAGDAGTVGSVGQFDVGTFVADGTTQDIVFQGAPTGGTLENAFVLTAVPEPSIWAMMFAGALASVAFVRRNRAASNS